MWHQEVWGPGDRQGNRHGRLRAATAPDARRWTRPVRTARGFIRAAGFRNEQTGRTGEIGRQEPDEQNESKTAHANSL